MPLASSRSRHPLASKLVPGLLVVSFAVRLSSVSGGLIGHGGGGWNFRSKGGGGVHSRLEGRPPTVKKVSATALLVGREREPRGVATLCPCFGAICPLFLACSLFAAGMDVDSCQPYKALLQSSASCTAADCAAAMIMCWRR